MRTATDQQPRLAPEKDTAPAHTPSPSPRSPMASHTIPTPSPISPMVSQPVPLMKRLSSPAVSKVNPVEGEHKEVLGLFAAKYLGSVPVENATGMYCIVEHFMILL